MKYFKIDEEYELKLSDDGIIWDKYQNGIILPRTAKKLFKYYSLNVNNIDSLLNHYFYLSNPLNFNDPFDCNVNLIEDIGDIQNSKQISRNDYLNIGLSSFSEEIDSHLMWAHYTSNYSGFVLEFEGDKITVDIQKNQLKRHSLARVIYPKSPPKILREYKFAQIYVFTTKFKHWAYEKEWRIIADLNTENRYLRYVPEIVKGIYIGHKIPDENRSAYNLLLEIAEIRYPSIPIYVVYPHRTELKLEFEKVWN